MRRLALLLIALAGCSSVKESADTTAQLTTDTVKPAPADSGGVTARDSVGATTTAKSAGSTRIKTKAASTGSSTIGRDRVIRFDMGAKERQMGKVLPPSDTAKKPPRE